MELEYSEEPTVRPPQPQRFRLMVTHGPDVAFDGFLIAQGWAQERDYRWCKVSLYKTMTQKYLVYITWKILQNPQSHLYLFEIVYDVKDIIKMLREEDRDTLLVEALKIALKSGGYDAVVSI